jgi:hypothetical protein
MGYQAQSRPSTTWFIIASALAPLATSTTLTAGTAFRQGAPGVAHSSVDDLVTREHDESSQLEGSTTTAFVDVTVIPMDTERILEHQTVIVEGSRILMVGDVADIDVPDNALRIDGAGLFLMPGLTDMHAHVDDDRDLMLFLANGVTTVRNMAGGPSHLDRRDRVASGLTLGPTIYTAGPIIDGPVELWPGNAAPPLAPGTFEVITTREEGERIVHEQAEAGYDFVKVYDNLPTEAVEGIISAAREEGLQVSGHVPFDVGLRKASVSGLASNEHLRGYIYELFQQDSDFILGWDKRSRFLAWNYIDTTRLAQAVRITAEEGLWNVPTLTRYQKNMMPTDEHIARYRSPEARYLDPSVLKRMLESRSNQEGRYGAFSESDYEAGRNVFANKKALARALHKAGAGLLLGSDDWFGGFSTHQELRNLVDAGLSPFEALVTGTRNPGHFLAARFGTVAPGMRADLLLLEENPLLDVGHAADRVGVMVRGQWLPQAELRKALEECCRTIDRASPHD